jgi:hypothetical protein
VFHSTLHTASTHAEISIDVTVSIWDKCSRTVLLCREFNHRMLVKWCIIYSHFVAEDYGEVWVHMQ